jgi:hypothetical protein
MDFTFNKIMGQTIYDLTNGYTDEKLPPPSPETWRLGWVGNSELDAQAVKAPTEKAADKNAALTAFFTRRPRHGPTVRGPGYYTTKAQYKLEDEQKGKQSKAKQSKSKATQSKAKQRKAKQSKAKQSKAKQSKTKQTNNI